MTPSRSPGFEANLQAAADFVTKALLDATPRAILIERRRTEYPAEHGASYPDFSPADGRCWKCNSDLVDEHYPTEVITGCRKCHRSFID